ncbi:hypothetical protein CANCADRAFT_142035 [Tortispora caseinolytica NRRL Y-17796]|uniref:DUF3835 domain-containing protein n=1 Tax=Tortispora caseinolytica NRRL Y-17796 TaxID=767744 RepID=A0A1E4TD20_9ASCO|nr:hypothetical protein CANCADRAFT_142035 [Tortispora caseinolytica NRRL Y-17796]
MDTDNRNLYIMDLLSRSLQALDGIASETTMVSLGDGYFAEMSIPDARQFLTRKINSLTPQNESLMTSEGLPTVDIVEKIDEDGNVIESSVRPHDMNDLQKFAESSLKQLRDKATGHENESGYENKKTNISDIEKTNISDIEKTNISDSEKTNISDIEKTAAVTPASLNESTHIEEIETTEIRNVSESLISTENEFPDDITKSMMEIEQLAAQALTFEIDIEDEEDEEYYDIDSEDEDEFGRTRGTLFPFDASKLLNSKDTDAEIDRNGSNSGESSDTSSKKNVRFSESIDVVRFKKNQTVKTPTKPYTRRSEPSGLPLKSSIRNTEPFRSEIIIPDSTSMDQSATEFQNRAMELLNSLDKQRSSTSVDSDISEEQQSFSSSSSSSEEEDDLSYSKPVLSDIIEHTDSDTISSDSEDEYDSDLEREKISAAYHQQRQKMLLQQMSYAERAKVDETQNDPDVPRASLFRRSRLG